GSVHGLGHPATNGGGGENIRVHGKMPGMLLNGTGRQQDHRAGIPGLGNLWTPQLIPYSRPQLHKGSVPPQRSCLNRITGNGGPASHAERRRSDSCSPPTGPKPQPEKPQATKRSTYKVEPLEGALPRTASAVEDPPPQS